MAENNEAPVLSQEQQEQRQSLDAQMNMALYGEMPKPDANEGGGASQQNDASQQQAAAAQQEPPVTSIQDLFQPIKEKFGYNSSEDAIKEIEELRTLKSSQATSALKFENEQSEKIFKALKEGKHDEVYDFLAKQKQLNQFTSGEINETNADQVIKLGMKLKYEDLSDAEIEYKFKKQYSIPKEPVQAADELDEEFLIRKQQWQDVADDVRMSKMIDAKLARPDLENAKSKLVVPEINSPVDEEYLNYKKMIEEHASKAEEIAQAYNSFNADALEKKVDFTDEPNKINFQFQYKPAEEKLKKAAEYASDINKLLDLFVTPDGKPDRKGFLEFVYYGLNKDEAIMEAMKQSKNATIKAGLPDNSNGSFNRQNPTLQEPSELHKQMQAAGIV